MARVDAPSRPLAWIMSLSALRPTGCPGCFSSPLGRPTPRCSCALDAGDTDRPRCEAVGVRRIAALSTSPIGSPPLATIWRRRPPHRHDHAIDARRDRRDAGEVCGGASERGLGVYRLTGAWVRSPCDRAGPLGDRIGRRAPAGRAGRTDFPTGSSPSPRSWAEELE